MPIGAVRPHRSNHGVDERAELVAPSGAATFPHQCRQLVETDESRRDGVFEVMANIGDAIGPRDGLSFRRRRRGPSPGVVANAVKRLGTQVQRTKRDVRTPNGVIEAALNEGIERLLARVPSRAVSTVVAKRDGLGQGNVETEGSSDARGDLGDFERVGEASAHVVVGEDEDLRLPREAAERARVQDAVAVALKAGAVLVGLFLECALSSAVAPRRAGSHQLIEEGLTIDEGAGEHRDVRSDVADRGARIAMGDGDLAARLVAAHGGGPPPRTLGYRFSHVFHLVASP